MNRDGRIDAAEMVNILTDLNDGGPPTAGEVAWVMQQAETDGDGKLDRRELVR